MRHARALAAICLSPPHGTPPIHPCMFWVITRLARRASEGSVSSSAVRVLRVIALDSYELRVTREDTYPKGWSRILPGTCKNSRESVQVVEKRGFTTSTPPLCTAWYGNVSSALQIRCLWRVIPMEGARARCLSDPASQSFR
eukprot:5430479-Prymnesium_polylepis.1